MSDHVELLRAWRAFANQNRPGYDHMADISYGGAPVCDADMDAALDEVERLRGDNAALIDGNQRLQTMNEGLRQLAIEAREAANGWHQATIDLYSGREEAAPDEQQPADVVTAEQQDGAAGRLRTAHALRAEHGIYDFAFDDDDVAAVLAELDAPATRVAELEGEREADARAALALLKLGEVLYLGQRPTDWADARRQLIARFADRIEALAAAETEES